MSALHGVVKRFHEGLRFFLIKKVHAFILVKEILFYTGKSPLGTL